MARLPRLYAPGCAQHIIQRGNNRTPCFFADVDYAVYLNKLHEYSGKYGVSIHAFVLMTNHVHLLATPKDKNSLSKMMQSLGRYYVRYVNSTYQRSGTLWEGRFKSTLVDSDEYLFMVYRYIELNPVRAGMVTDPAEYPWSSYQANCLGKKIVLITSHALYDSLGDTSESRCVAYGEIVKEVISDNSIDDIRNATNSGWALGGSLFKREIEDAANRRVESLGYGGDRKSKVYREKLADQ